MSIITDAAIIGLDELTNLMTVLASGVQVTFEMMIVTAVTTM
jgi:hypothetical protein